MYMHVYMEELSLMPRLLLIIPVGCGGSLIVGIVCVL